MTKSEDRVRVMFRDVYRTITTHLHNLHYEEGNEFLAELDSALGAIITDRHVKELLHADEEAHH